ncbi:acetate kinase, partial [Vibrio cholerae O1]|nr:acetate kinase [Vibrio cholerae O1]
EDISRILNRESGLLGVSESSSDMRDIHTAMQNGDEKAKLAYDKFTTDLRQLVQSLMKN